MMNTSRGAIIFFAVNLCLPATSEAGNNVCTEAAYNPAAPEFEKAAQKEGCQTIPYLSLCRDCRETQDKVEDSCKRQEHSCKQDRMPMAGMRTQIRQQKARIAETEKRQNEAFARFSSQGDKEAKKQADAETENIRALSRELYKMQDDLTKELRARLAIASDCADSRERVQNIFKWTKEKLASLPPDLQKYEAPLVAIYKAEEDGHDEATLLAWEARDYCRKALNDLDVYTDFNDR